MEAQHITLRLPAELVNELRAVATENERSLSAEARLALKAWLHTNGGRALPPRDIALPQGDDRTP